MPGLVVREGRATADSLDERYAFRRNRTLTGSLAETVARRGGLTIIPQDIPVDVVIDTVNQVKAAHGVYDTPVTVKPHHTCGYAMGLIPKRSHGAAVVIDPGTERPVGMVDLNDVTGVDRFTQVQSVMSTELVTVPAGTDPREAFADRRAHV